ncbi:MAG: hypothetical protein KIT83_06370 [Bryobacterales bacterium]|nr:hypothetical protein [Bryobacterales bacterium]
MAQAGSGSWKMRVWLGALTGCSLVSYRTLVEVARTASRETDAELPGRILLLDEWVGSSLLLFVFYLFLVFLLTNSVYTPDRRRWGIAAILAIALLFRASAVLMSPALSDDVFRYRWEGKLQAAGGNPYAIAPDDPAWTHVRDSTFARIPIRDYPGGYGPIVMMAERAAFWLARAVSPNSERQALVMKLPAMLGDLAVMGLLLGWLRTRGRPLAWLSVYALCPLPVIEFWGMGHNDALALAFLVAAFFALDTRRDAAGFLLLGCAVAVKWWPALLFPTAVGFGRETPRRALLAALGLLVVPAAMLPYWTDISLNLRFMGGFAGGWRNNDSLFGITHWLASGDFETAKQWTLALIAIWCVAVPLIFRDRIDAALAVIAGTLLLSANCHPWYLTWLLPFLVFSPWPPLLLWVGLSPLFYEVLIDYHLLGVWDGSRPGRWLVYGPVFAVMAGYTFMAWVRRAKGSCSMRPSGKQ